MSYIFCIFLLRNARNAPSVAVIAAYSIIAIAASLVVYLIGKLGRHRGSYLFTLLGSGLGMGIYIAIIFTMNALGLCPS